MTEIKVVFFASLKESLGLSEYRLKGEFPMTIEAIKQSLAKQLPNGEVLLSSQLQASIDFEFARDADTVTESVKEVAFFPPVTGG